MARSSTKYHAARVLAASLYSPARMFWFLTGLIIFSVLIYGVFLERAINATAVRSSIEQELAQMSTDIGALESRYMAAKRAISLDLAQSVGLTEVANPLFISRAEHGRVLTQLARTEG